MESYYERHREEISAKRKARYASDPEYREKQKANARRQSAKRDPEAERLRKNASRRADPNRLDKRRAEQAKVRRDVIEGYGGVCACCGNAYPPHLTLDHIDGGGAAERRATCQRSIMRRLRREGFPPGYQVLCWNCNAAKHHVPGGCDCQAHP